MRINEATLMLTEKFTQLSFSFSFHYQIIYSRSSHPFTRYKPSVRHNLDLRPQLLRHIFLLHQTQLQHIAPEEQRTMLRVA